jgi:hypothetical protein
LRVRGTFDCRTGVEFYRHPLFGQGRGLDLSGRGYEYAGFAPKSADGSTRYGVEIEMQVLEEDLRRLPRIPPVEARETIKEIQDILPRLQKMLVWYAPQDEVADRAKRPIFGSLSMPWTA